MSTGGGRTGPSPLAALKAKADALMARGQAADARSLYAQICAVNRQDVDSRVKLALAHREVGDFAAAEKEARRAVKAQPGLFLGYYALGLALHSRGQAPEAVRAYRTAAKLQPRFPDTHYLLGIALHEIGRLADAADAFEAALRERPNYLQALSGLAAVRLLQGQWKEAEGLLRNALQLDPNAPEALVNLGALRVKGEAVDEAMELYRRAAELAPGRLDIQAQIASLLEKQGRWDEAKAALDAVPGVEREPEAAMVLARIARRERRYADGVAVLEQARSAADRFLAGEAEILTGQLLDQLGETDSAFAHLTAGNANVAMAMGVDLTQPPAYLEDVALARSFLTPGLVQSRAASTDGPPAPVFLIGFPRSGTTLLEQVLDSHPQIQTMEERPVIPAVRERFLEMAAEGATLETLTAEQVADLRAYYFETLDGYVTRRPDAVFVDKLPLNTVWAHLIWRIFPDARFILALRHPLDVCLGCFMQHFAINTAMSSFLSLPNTAATYAAVMGLWRDIVDALPLSAHTVRYEDVVDDLPGQAAALLSFLDLPWDPAVLDPGRTARGKSIVNTPSYHQVSQPIYRQAAYRWRRYDQHLTAITPTVAPFVALFGYD